MKKILLIFTIVLFTVIVYYGFIRPYPQLDNAKILIEKLKWQETNKRLLACQLVTTVELSKEYEIDPYLVLAIRYVESNGKLRVQAKDFFKTGSINTYQSTVDNIRTYSNMDVCTVNYDFNESTEVCLRYLKDCKTKLNNTNRIIVAYNKGIDGCRKLSDSEVNNHYYLGKVLKTLNELKTNIKL